VFLKKDILFKSFQNNYCKVTTYFICCDTLLLGAVGFVLVLLAIDEYHTLKISGALLSGVIFIAKFAGLCTGV